jgi:hypothetical protein
MVKNLIHLWQNMLYTYVYMSVCFSIYILHIFQTAGAQQEMLQFALLQKASHGCFPVALKAV